MVTAVAAAEQKLEGASLEEALEAMGPLEALDGSECSPLELADFLALPRHHLHPVSVLKRLHDEPELCDLVMEGKQQDLIDRMIVNQLPPHQQVQATQTHHHHHIMQSKFNFYYY